MKTKRIIIIAFFLPISFWGISQKKVEISPRKSVAKVVLAGKYDYTYFALSENSKTEYRVTGPGKMTLNFRVRIEGDKFRSEPFRVKYIRSEKHVATVDIPELLAGNLKFKSKDLKGNPTRLHKVDIDVPPGKQTYSFYKYKTDQKTSMRAFYEAYPKPVWEDLLPTYNLDKKDVVFIESGTSRSYYRITKKSSFNFSISDTIQLRVIVRPEFSYNMLEETVLKMKLSNLTSGQSKIYKVNSNKSNKLEFVSDDKMTPGTSTTFYLNLDQPLRSEDSYSIGIVSGAKAAVLRISKNKIFKK